MTAVVGDGFVDFAIVAAMVSQMLIDLLIDCSMAKCAADYPVSTSLKAHPRTVM